MKHINLSKSNESGLSEYMVTQESNNFGDQILSLKKLVTEKQDPIFGPVTTTGYKIIAITSRVEGDWMNEKQMKSWLKNVLKVEVSQ